jgi:hypothetical protein
LLPAQGLSRILIDISHIDDLKTIFSPCVSLPVIGL